MLEELAFEIAKAAHAGQTDKAGLDYILHPLQPAFPNCVTIITRKTAITIDI